MKLLTQPLARLLVLMGLMVLSASSFAQGTCPANATCDALPGYYKVGNVITAASIGSYVATAGATAQTACPANSTTTATAATAATTCLAAPGFYVSGNSIVACPTGSTTLTVGQTTCVATPGFFKNAADSFVACPPGTYSATAGATGCTQAANNFFVAVAGSAGQTACPSGSGTSVLGSRTCFWNGTFGQCPAGSFIDGQNTSTTRCGACPAGTYTSTTMTYTSSLPTPRSCNACAGKTNQVIGSTSCS